MIPGNPSESGVILALLALDNPGESNSSRSSTVRERLVSSAPAAPFSLAKGRSVQPQLLLLR